MYQRFEDEEDIESTDSSSSSSSSSASSFIERVQGRFIKFQYQGRNLRLVALNKLPEDDVLQDLNLTHEIVETDRILPKLKLYINHLIDGGVINTDTDRYIMAETPSKDGKMRIILFLDVQGNFINAYSKEISTREATLLIKPTPGEWTDFVELFDYLFQRPIRF